MTKAIDLGRKATKQTNYEEFLHIISDQAEKEVIEEPIVDPKHKKRKKTSARRLKLGLCSQS